MHLVASFLFVFYNISDRKVDEWSKRNTPKRNLKLMSGAREILLKEISLDDILVEKARIFIYHIRMKVITDIRLLSTTFYNNYSHKFYPEILLKENRPYLLLLLEIDGIKYGIPFRSNIKHRFCYKFKNSQRNSSFGTGLDFSKSIVILDDSFLGNKATIDALELAELKSKYVFIKTKFCNYIRSFKRYLKGKIIDPTLVSLYGRSTLNYFKEVIIDDQNKCFELLVATNNTHKLKEIREILSPHGVIVYGMSDLNIHLEDIEENGKTYYENALIKAKALQKYSKLPIIADDSGLEIYSMNNEPGLFTARFAESLGGHTNAFKEIFKRIEGKDRRAWFICNIVLVNVKNEPISFEARINGHIANKIDGDGGFGYDPIFMCDEVNKTYAKLSQEEKNRVSHRGKALKKLLTYLKINGYAR